MEQPSVGSKTLTYRQGTNRLRWLEECTFASATLHHRHLWLLFAAEEEVRAGAMFHRLTFRFYQATSFFWWVLVVGVFCLLFCWLSLVVSFDGQSNERTFESTNDFKSQGTMTATVVTTSATIVQKKTPESE